MKKIFLFIFTFLFAYAVKAQTEQGRITIGSNLEFMSTKHGYNDVNTNAKLLFFNVSAGYFFMNDFQVGLGAGYTYTANNQNIAIAGRVFNAKLRSPIYSISPFARYYSTITGQLKFFGQVMVPMNFSKFKANVENTQDVVTVAKSKSIGVALSPGIVFFPTNKIGIEFSVVGLRYGYNNYKAEPSYSYYKNSTSDKFSLGANFLSPNIGIQFYL